MYNRPQSREVSSERSITSRKDGGKQKNIHKVSLRLNKAGGIDVTPIETKLAFDLWDPEKIGSIKRGDLMRLFTKFGYNFPEKDFSSLFDAPDEKITLAMLNELLEGNEVNDFDPVREAFKFLDKQGDGYITVHEMSDHLQIYFPNFRLTQEDIVTLCKTFGIPNQDRITLQNFRELLDHLLPSAEEEEDSQTRKIVIYQVNANKNNGKSENKE